jgi:hypothetical protein
MSQEDQHPCDRDCLIAATLAAGGVEGNRSVANMVIRFREILQAIHKAGGSHQIWSDAQDREGEGDSNTIV